MALEYGCNILFALLIDDELHEPEVPQKTIQEHPRPKPMKRVIKCLTEPSKASSECDEIQAVQRNEEPKSKKRRMRKGCDRSGERNYDRGGMMAFHHLSNFETHFGLTRMQVEILLRELKPHYAAERGSKLPLENVVLSSLWVLSSQECYRLIAERFQTSKSVICTALHRFCLLVSENLEHWISWPSGRAVQTTVKGFEELGFPGTVGAMDACQIAINKPKDVLDPEPYYISEKHTYCTKLLCVCDHKCRFTYVNVGHPGNFDDAEVFRRCDLYEALQSDPDSLLPASFRMNNRVYSHHIIVDSAFPLSPFVLTPYEDTEYSLLRRKLYNRKHSSALVVIMRTIGMLKGRFSRLRMLLMQHLAQCSVAIKACCILHNMCIENGQDCHIVIDEGDIPPTCPKVNSKSKTSIEGEIKRNAIAHSFS